MRIARRRLLEGAAVLGVGACAPTPKVMAPARGADALGDDDAVGIAQRIRAKEITALEAAEAAIRRAEAINPRIEAIVTEAYDLAQARAGQPIAGPFAGAPTLIKDLMPLKGVRFTEGSRAYENRIADAQSPYVEALLAAGLNPIGKSATPEFGLTATTEPMLSAPTRDPWDVSRSSGGSSGGAAAAVAAGIVPVAHASDGGGSIRIPSSCCGLFGLKVSRGREIGSEGVRPPVDIGVNHCVSRSVRDSALWLSIAERRDAAAPHKPVGLVAGPDTRRLKIGLSFASLTGRAPDPEVREGVEEAAALLRRLGHTVADYKPDIDGRKTADAFILYWASGAAQDGGAAMKANPGAAPETILEPWTLGLMQAYASAPAGAIDTAIATLKDVEKRFVAMFTDIDVLMTPVLTQPPPALGAIAPTKAYADTLPVILDYVGYTPLQNIAGAPAISAPLWWTKGGLPVGVHFSAAPGKEALLLSLAFELERAQPWANRKPPVHA
jgi:amidase